jgi:Na+-driven multidrug efflux pump
MSAHNPLVQQQKLWKAFFIFLMPLIATNILQNLSGTINTVFVGQMMGVQAIAAVAVFFPILFCLMAFVIGLSAGSTVLIGQAWGAQNIEKVRAVVGSTLFMTLIGGSFIAFLGVVFARPILSALGIDENVRFELNSEEGLDVLDEFYAEDESEQTQTELKTNAKPKFNQREDFVQDIQQGLQGSVRAVN